MNLLTGKMLPISHVGTLRACVLIVNGKSCINICKYLLIIMCKYLQFHINYVINETDFREVILGQEFALPFLLILGYD